LRAPVSAGTAVAQIESAGKVWDVMANGDGFLWEKLVEPGQVLRGNEKIAMIAADGENVPYGRPYSSAQFAELKPDVQQTVSQKKERASFR
jgi:pyruvate/2-oxoglutarate dehydrogenase complex dihydrolipoamide acyltransferase (E2) component